MNQEQLLIAEIVGSLITVGIPSCVTLITYFHQSRRVKRNAAKQSILQMVMEDQLNWELFSKFPTNYGDIHDEYAIYHKNGGNGEVTKRVNYYNEWYLGVEKQLEESKKPKYKGGRNGEQS